jgi:hypothetical protein
VAGIDGIPQGARVQYLSVAVGPESTMSYTRAPRRETEPCGAAASSAVSEAADARFNRRRLDRLDPTSSPYFGDCG